MFVIKHKFKVGDIVRCVSAEFCCASILNKICIIKELYDKTVYNASEHKEECGYYVCAHDGIADLRSGYYVGEWMLEPVVNSYTPSDRLTDPNTNYKELFKEPMYIEFIDVGEAFDKLKMYEDKEHSTAVGLPENYTTSELCDSEIKIGDIVFFPSKYTTTLNIRCAKVQKVYPMFIRIEYPSGSTFDLNRKECFKTYEEALAHLK